MAEINKETRDSFYKELTQRLAPEGCREAFDRAVDIAAEVKQYLQLMDAAPFLKAMSLDEQYKLLADYHALRAMEAERRQ